MGEHALAQEVAEETLARLAEVGDTGVRANVLGEVALYHLSTGDLSLAMELLNQATDAARQIGDRRREARNAVNIGFLSVQLGLYSKARAVLEAGMALAEMIGERGMLATLRDNLSFVYWCMGERTTAIALTEQLLAEFSTNPSNPFSKAACLAQFGLFQTDIGNWSLAATYLLEARNGYAALGAKQVSLELQGPEARCQYNLGHKKLAEKLASEVWSYLREYGSTGFSFPARVYLDLADVFAGLEMPSAQVEDVIALGYHDLMQRSGRISNPEWRQSFLENVVENRTIVERWKKLTGNL
jgi:tetratricopeptide (TPR) repeat protein